METDPRFSSIEASILAILQRRPPPSLDDLAAEAGLSPAHFQRVFKALTGLSPKQMSLALSRQRLLAALRSGHVPVLDAALTAGLSGPSRAHELLLSTDGATPAEWARQGAGLTIRCATVDTAFGPAFGAWTGRGLAALRLAADAAAGPELLRRDWPEAEIVEDTTTVAPIISAALEGRGVAHVRGTRFQVRVWQAIISLPAGTLLSYGQVAEALQLPGGSRAVGRALGQNPVAVLIPCHRVIQATGAFNGYRWGVGRKAMLIGRELG